VWSASGGQKKGQAWRGEVAFFVVFSKFIDIIQSKGTGVENKMSRGLAKQ